VKDFREPKFRLSTKAEQVMHGKLNFDLGEILFRSRGSSVGLILIFFRSMWIRTPILTEVLVLKPISRPCTDLSQ
jgi:hypothetical protein